MAKVSKKTAWIGSILSLIVFISLLYFAIDTSKVWLIVLSSIAILIYLFAIGLLVLDYYLTREEYKPTEYKKTK